jgi:hypothetical protein
MRLCETRELYAQFSCRHVLLQHGLSGIVLLLQTGILNLLWTKHHKATTGSTHMLLTALVSGGGSNLLSPQAKLAS